MLVKTAGVGAILGVLVAIDGFAATIETTTRDETPAALVYWCGGEIVRHMRATKGLDLVKMTAHTARQPQWWWLGTLLLIFGALTLAGCAGGATDNAGVNLGNGPLLAFIGGDGNLWLAKADGSSAHAVTVTQCPTTISCYGPPAWSPDGQSVALFGPEVGNQSNNVIYVYNRQGLLQQTIHPTNPLSFGRLLWSNDSKMVAYPGNPTTGGVTKGAPSYALVLLVVSSGAKSGAITLPSPSNAQCNDSPRGGPLGSLVERAVYGSTGQGLRDTLDWSADGQHILISGGDCNTQVAVVNRSGNSQTLAPLSSATSFVVQAQFSSDARQIVATETGANQDDLVTFNADGSGGKVIYTDTDAPPDFAPRLGAPSWSHDGKQIYFMRGTDIWAINADGSNAHQLIAGAAKGDPQKSEAAPLPSPDGAHLVWNELSLSASSGTPITALYSGDANGGNAKLIADGAVWAAYSAK